jgi:hypothetical protein
MERTRNPSNREEVVSVTHFMPGFQCGLAGPPPLLGPRFASQSPACFTAVARRYDNREL